MKLEMKLKINSKWDRKRETIWKMKANGNEIEPRVNKKRGEIKNNNTTCERPRRETGKNRKTGPCLFSVVFYFFLIQHRGT